MRTLRNVLLLSIAGLAFTGRAQESVRIVTAAPDQATEIRDDGTWELRGDSLPDHLLFQNFLIVLHLNSLNEERSGVLDQMGIEPASAAATVLHNAADEAYPIIEKEIGGEKDLDAWRRLGVIWRQMALKLEAEGVMSRVIAYVDSEIRSGTSLAVSPDSQPDFYFQQRQRQTAFEGGP
jgi:hypothetical protein